MTCKDVQRLAPLRLSGELESEQTGEIEQHLSTCVFCRRFLLQQQELDQAIRFAVESEPLNATPIHAATMSHIQHSRMSLWNLRMPVWVTALVASFAVLLIAGGVVVANQRSAMYFRAAGKDHVDDLVKAIPKSGWKTTEPEIRSYLASRLNQKDGFERLSVSAYSLLKARDCRLANRTYVHLVYAKGDQRISVYLLPHHQDVWHHMMASSLFHLSRTTEEQHFEVTRDDSGTYTIFIVGNLPRTEEQTLAVSVLRSLT